MTMCSLFFMLCSLCAMVNVHGEIVTVEWTPEGVKNHSSYSNPLQVQLGDDLRLTCQENVSNLFIQDEQIQYDNCNASAGSGRFDFNGFCLQGNTLELRLKRNSQSLMNTVNFVDNTVYYLSSYSSGMLKGANDPNINSGGQCEGGLKMIIIIGEVPLEPDGSLPTDGSSASSSVTPQSAGVRPSEASGEDHKVPTWIYVAVAGGVFALILSVLAIVIIVFCVLKVRRKKTLQPATHTNVYCHTSSADLLDGGTSVISFNVQTETPKRDLSALDNNTGQAKTYRNQELNYTDVTVTVDTFGKKASSTPNILSQFSEHPTEYAKVDFNDTRSVDGFLAAPVTFVPMNSSSENLLKSPSKAGTDYSPSPAKVPPATQRKPKPLPPPKPV